MAALCVVPFTINTRIVFPSCHHDARHVFETVSKHGRVDSARFSTDVCGNAEAGRERDVPHDLEDAGAAVRGGCERLALVPHRKCLHIRLSLLKIVGVLPSAVPDPPHMSRFTPILLNCVVLHASALAQQPDFAHDVVPILKEHCAECHTGEKSEGGFSFNTQRQLIESGYVKSGKPDASRLIELVASHDVEDQMPPQDRKRLTQEEIDVLRRWVATEVAWEPGFRFASSAYEPPLLPREVELPAAEFSGQNPIDRILSVYRQQQSLPRGESVDDHVFLRRVYMDLVGLTPTFEQQQQFLHNEGDGHREQLVDRLLRNNHAYAEHWMSFWNDLLRNDYAGTGFIDGGRTQITSWLYTALVRNLPYDEFVRELLTPVAGAEGFINGIKWRGNVNASQVREVQFAQNVSQVFLGINMKCASCHDSFIDHWTLDEAYGLAAIYSTRALEIHRCDKPVGRTAKAAWIFPEIGDVDPDAAQPERLKQLATVMTSPQNGRFSRTMVNRLWHRMMGHGIVHPVDAMHTEPWSEDLLDYLANDLVANNFDVKQTLRLITTSQAYQCASAAAQDSATADGFVFHGPTARLLTAEQFIDSVWQLTHAPPQKIDAPIPADVFYGDDLPKVERNGQWLWSYAGTNASPAGEVASFRKTFVVKAKPRLARLVITCDNEYTAWLNGKKIGGDTNWTTIDVLNLTRHLKVGENELLVVGRNAGATPNPAGLYAEIILVDSKDRKTRIATDESWQAIVGDVKPAKAAAPEWRKAALVEPQNFLGPGAEASITLQLSMALADVMRGGRSAFSKSNLLLRSLGRPNREQVVTTRPASLSTLQAIDLANGEILDGILAAGAARLHADASDPAEFAVRLFRETLCREPSIQERDLSVTLLGESPTVASVQDLLWMLVMLPEFQFVQ